MKSDKQRARTGFTLIELLVVIAIIAILSVVVVLTLNPAEMLRRGRDSNRLSDLSVFQSAMNVYTQDRAVSGGLIGLGTSSVIYISIPDPAASTAAGSDCSNLGFPAGGTYHCAGPNYFRRTDGTGWIPVNLASITTGSPLGQLPIDPTNVSSTGEYYEYTTDGTNWKMAAAPESTQYASQFASFSSGTTQNLLGGFPSSGWVSVPGNSTFGTHNFAVMQYDADCSDGKGNYLNDTTGSSDTTNYQVYANSGTGGIACTGSRSVASLPGGYPIADIAEQPTAKAYCNAIGAHLLTNDEYMTIAMNAANQGVNWNGGTVGGASQYMPSGNSNASYAEPAGGNPEGYLSGSTSTYYSDFHHLRTLTLSNGQVIWDLAGNVWEEVQRSDMNQGDNQNTMFSPTCTTGSWVWCEFASSTAWTSDPTTALTASQVSPPNGWTSSQGMGQLYAWGPGGIGGGTNAFIRGGNWTGGAGGGPFTLYLLWYTGYTNSTVGFRGAR